MTDEIIDDIDEPIEDIEVERRGSLMRELESWERIIDGLKMGAEGARHMARFRHADDWNRLASFFDSIRKAVIKDGGFDRSADATDSTQKFGGEGLSWSQAQRRIADGMKMAAAGAEQIAICQRNDIRWVRYASQFRTFADMGHKLAMQSSPLLTEKGWRDMRSGLLVPSRLN